jgi:hypothetical protein
LNDNRYGTHPGSTSAIPLSFLFPFSEVQGRTFFLQGKQPGPQRQTGGAQGIQPNRNKNGQLRQRGKIFLLPGRFISLFRP